MLLTGSLTRLVALEADQDAELHARWSRDVEFFHLFNFGPARGATAKQAREWLERDADDPNTFVFTILTQDGGKRIGLTDLSVLPRWQDAYLGIGIGERDYWGKGYGTEAVRLVAQFGFAELNLHRITLSVFEFNTRAIRSYEKVGFVVEGRSRQLIQRAGRRWDSITMGLLRSDWKNHGY